MIGSGRSHNEELASLDERLGILLLVRAAIGMAVLVVAAVAPDQIGVGPGGVAYAVTAYLLVTGASEWVARRVEKRRLAIHRVLLLVDAAFLAWTTFRPGGAVGPALLLTAATVAAVTLLASPRSALRLVLWSSAALVLWRLPQVATVIAQLRHVTMSRAPTPGTTVVAIAGLWGVLALTAAGAAVSERELRRTKAELVALAAMATALEARPGAGEVLDGLLTGLGQAFEFRRAVVVWDDGEAMHLRRRPAPGPPGPDGYPDATSRPFADAVAVEAWRSKAPVLLRSLDPERDPVLSGLLPGARHVAVLPLGPDGHRQGVVALEVGHSSAGHGLPQRTLTALSQFTAHSTLALRNARLTAERERLARRDALTGLANRRQLDEVLDAEVSRALRNGTPLALVVLDLDHFKRINDEHGHPAGDEVLRQVGRALGATVRRMDTAARYGGEEFALVLPSCPTEGALRVAESARAAISGSVAGLTVSVGVAVLPIHAGDAMSLLHAADAALYRSKRQGRDRVSVAAAGANLARLNPGAPGE